MELLKKRVLITGGAKRVGRVIALALAKKGASILLHCHNSLTEAEITASEIKALGVSCEILQADLSRVDQIHAMTKKISTPVDILINSASAFYKTPIREVTEKNWDELLDANLKGPFFLSQELASRMANGTGGKIINIADWSGIRPYKDYAPYCASKGGLITLTKALARDFAPKVSVNAVAPGPVMMPENFSQDEVKAIANLTAVGRIGTPEDIANAVIFLLENDFINGTVLTVDGGRSIV